MPLEECPRAQRRAMIQTNKSLYSGTSYEAGGKVGSPVPPQTQCWSEQYLAHRLYSERPVLYTHSPHSICGLQTLSNRPERIDFLSRMVEKSTYLESCSTTRVCARNCEENQSCHGRRGAQKGLRFSERIGSPTEADLAMRSFHFTNDK